MSNITENYHTHANGAEYGWWGEIVHPAHFNENGKQIPHTSFRVTIHNASSLEDCRAQALAKASPKLRDVHSSIQQRQVSKKMEDD